MELDNYVSQRINQDPTFAVKLAAVEAASAFEQVMDLVVDSVANDLDVLASRIGIDRARLEELTAGDSPCLDELLLFCHAFEIKLRLSSNFRLTIELPATLAVRIKKFSGSPQAEIHSHTGPSRTGGFSLDKILGEGRPQTGVSVLAGHLGGTR